MIPQEKKQDVEVLRWCGYTWSAFVRPFGCTANSRKTTLDVAYGREMNIQLSGNSSGGHSSGQHANSMLPQLETSVALCCLTSFNFSGLLLSTAQGAPVVMILPFNQLLGKPHLSGRVSWQRRNAH
jgi:hypothetical protein